MTCIVALKHNGKIYMGADSAAVAGYSVNKMANPKLFKIGDMLVGYTSSFRMGQLLEHKFCPPLNERDSDYAYMVIDVVEEVRKLFKDFGYANVENNEETAGTFIIGYRGELYKMSLDYSVLQFDRDYMATGCAQDIALGALYTGADFPPRMRLTQALSAAAEFSAGVCEPFTFLEIE